MHKLPKTFFDVENFRSQFDYLTFDMEKHTVNSFYTFQVYAMFSSIWQFW